MVAIDCTVIGASPPTSTGWVGCLSRIWRVVRRGARTGGGQRGHTEVRRSWVKYRPASADGGPDRGASERPRRSRRPAAHWRSPIVDPCQDVRRGEQPRRTARERRIRLGQPLAASGRTRSQPWPGLPTQPADQPAIADTSTEPVAQLVTVAVSAVTMTTSRLVPRAVSASLPVSSTRPGTMMIPPPTPSRPASVPAATPDQQQQHALPSAAEPAGGSPAPPSSTSRAAVAMLQHAEPELQRRRSGYRGSSQAPELAADHPADQRAAGQREVDVAVHGVARGRRGRDRHDRQQAGGAGATLVQGEPRHQQRDHDDPAADPEQPGQQPGRQPDRGGPQPAERGRRPRRPASALRERRPARGLSRRCEIGLDESARITTASDTSDQHDRRPVGQRQRLDDVDRPGSGRPRSRRQRPPAAPQIAPATCPPSSGRSGSEVEQEQEQVEAGHQAEQDRDLGLERLLGGDDLAGDPPDADDADRAVRVALLAGDHVLAPARRPGPAASPAPGRCARRRPTSCAGTGAHRLGDVLGLRGDADVAGGHDLLADDCPGRRGPAGRRWPSGPRPRAARSRSPGRGRRSARGWTGSTAVHLGPRPRRAAR